MFCKESVNMHSTSSTSSTTSGTSFIRTINIILKLFILSGSYTINVSFAESFTFEVKDTAVLPCVLPVYDAAAYWFYTGGVASEVRMYLSLNDKVYYNDPAVMKRFGRRMTVENDTTSSSGGSTRSGNSFDLHIRNLSFADVGEYRCGYIGPDRIIEWVDVHLLNVSEAGVYDVECAVHAPLVPSVGSTVELYCEIPPQSIYPQKEVELIWYKNGEMLFTASGLFAPSLAVRLQRTLIDSDFGAKFTCVGYDEHYQPKGQCSVSSFQIPAMNVTVRRLLSSQQEDASAGSRDLRLICVANSLSYDSEREFSWHLGGLRIFPQILPHDRDESASTEQVNNMEWTFENGGEMLTFHGHHSDVNGSVVVCGVRSQTVQLTSAPFVVMIPSDDFEDRLSGEGGSQGNDAPAEDPGSGSPDVLLLHDAHHFSVVLAILAFIGGIVLAVCVAAVYVNVKQRRRNHGPVDELRWMPIQNTAAEYRSGPETFVKRRYVKPSSKRLNVHERFKRRSGGDFPIASEHAHQVCLRNKVKEAGKRDRGSPSVDEDMYSFPLSYSDIPEFRSTRSSSVLRDLSRSSSLVNLHLALPSGKSHYVNLPSKYSIPFNKQNERSNSSGTRDDGGMADVIPKSERLLRLEDSTTGNDGTVTPNESAANRKTGRTVAYAELDLDHLRSMQGTSPARKNESVAYAEISHVMSEQVGGQRSATESTTEADVRETTQSNFI